MIKEAYCSDNVCKLLKEKGFKEPCTDLNKLVIKDGEKLFMKVTHQKAMAWLREEKRIFVRIIEDCTGEVFRYEIYNHTPDNNGNYYISNTYINSYEDTVEAALKYCLENLI